MKITELLITGYDGDRPVFVVDILPETAKVVLTKPGDDGQTAVDAATEEATPIFFPIQKLLEGVVVVSP